MTLLIRELERVEWRVLGALRCVDASTRAGIDAPLQLRAEGVRLRRNGSGLYVIVRADALAEHEREFAAPPADPALGSVALDIAIHDASGRYLPRRVQVELPRDPDPGRAGQADSLFSAIEVEMLPASAAPLAANWSVLRVDVHEAASGDALGGALLIVTRGASVLARGLSDWRGQALVPVPGVPVTTWSTEPGAVVVSEIAVQLELVFDPDAGSRVTAASVRAGRPPAALPVADPDRLYDDRLTLPRAVRALLLAAGRAQTVSFPLALP